MDKAPKIENAEQELSAEQKKSLAQAWCSVVLGREATPDNIEAFSNEQVRAWLYDSLISETLVLRNEWGLNPDIEQYREAMEGCTDDVQRSDVQFRFIDSFNDGIASFDESHPRGLNRPRRWESWPKTMRDSKSFNCVGATLFAFVSLEEAGIEVSEGDPAGHSVAIARLADGEHVYVDANNDNVFVIRPEEKNIGGVRCLVVRDPRIEYEIIPVFDRHNLVKSVLGNLSGVLDDLKHGNYESKAQEQRTKEIYLAQKEMFDSIDFREFKRLLYGPDKDPWNNSDEPAFEVEFQKVELLHDFAKAKKDLSPEIINELVGVLLKNSEDIKQFMLDVGHSIPGISDALREVLVGMHENAWRLSHGNQAAISKAIEHFAFQVNYRFKKVSPPTAS